MTRPRFVAFALVPLVPAVGFVPVYTFLPVALAAMFGLSPAEAGAFLLPISIPVLAGPVLAARLMHRIPWVRADTIVYISIAVLLIGDIGLLLLSPERPLAIAVLPLLLVSLGYGLQMGLIDSEAMSAVPERSTGIAAGIVNFCRTGSAAVVVTLYGMGLAALIGKTLPPEIASGVAAGREGHASAYASAFHSVSVVSAGVVVILGGLVVWLQRRARRAESVSVDVAECRVP